MRIYPALIYTLQDLAYDWGRSSLTILTLTLLTAIYLIVSTFSGALQTRRSSFSAASNNLLVLSAAVIDPMDSTLDQQALDIVTGRTQSLFGDQAVQSTSPLILRNMRIEGHVLQVAAARVEDLEDVFQVQLLHGAWPAANDQIVVSPAVLNLTQRESSDSLQIYGRDFSIQGVISAPGNRAAVWMPYQAGADLFSRQRGFQIGVLQLDPGLDPNQVQTALETDPAISGRYAVYLEQQYASKTFQSIQDFYQLAGVFQILALLVIAFGAYHSAHLTLSERSAQLAILPRHRIFGIHSGRPADCPQHPAGSGGLSAGSRAGVHLSAPAFRRQIGIL